MTHDKLLRSIEWAGHTTTWSALRAVVELHNPIEGHEHLCGGCWFGDGMMPYPCPTIQAIEKELSHA
jgi:hypothetical protein